MNDHEKQEVSRDVYVSLRDHFAALRAEDNRRVDERFAALSKALELQATEYERRLHDLNGEYQRDRQRQNDYVTVDKWETKNESEEEARESALLRVNEKFDEYIKRYEARQREVDLLLSAQAGAAGEAKRAVEDAVRKSDSAARDQARKQNRNLAIASLLLGGLVFAAQIIPLLTQ